MIARDVMKSVLFVLGFASLCFAEYEDAPATSPEPGPNLSSSAPSDKEADAPVLRPKQLSQPGYSKDIGNSKYREGSENTRKYFVPDPSRVDAGVFHVAFAVGGNFYVEPEVASISAAPTGNYFKDFGFQGGVYFDYDYSELPENIPLALRAMVGYKYVLSSVHVFTFDGMVRRMIRMSENASFGFGIGGSAAVWYRQQSDRPIFANEEMVFLPSFIVGAGFDFNPFMVDFKWLINRFGQDSTITGLEFYFGFRL